MSGADDLVAAARAGLRRLTPVEAAEACARGALLVDVVGVRVTRTGQDGALVTDGAAAVSKS